MKVTDVVAAIIQMNNLYFIAQRNKNKHLGSKWEFPGGKVNKNENYINALRREIKEELNIDITINKKVGQINYKDNKINITLHYYICEIIKGNIKLNEHENSLWLTKEKIINYDLTDGDKKILNFF